MSGASVSATGALVALSCAARARWQPSAEGAPAPRLGASPAPAGSPGARARVSRSPTAPAPRAPAAARKRPSSTRGRPRCSLGARSGFQCVSEAFRGGKHGFFTVFMEKIVVDTVSNTDYNRNMKQHGALALTLVIALWVPCWLILSTLLGCQTEGTTPPYPIAPAAERVITNTVYVAGTTFGSLAPPPFGTAAEAAAAAVLALLAAWQGITHREVKRMSQNQPQPVPIEKL